MILIAEMLFEDQMAEKMGREEQLIWQESYFDLAEISSICPFQKDNELVQEHSEITFKSGYARVVNVPFDAMALIMRKIWGPAKNWEDFLK